MSVSGFIPDLAKARLGYEGLGTHTLEGSVVEMGRGFRPSGLDP